MNLERMKVFTHNAKVKIDVKLSSLYSLAFHKVSQDYLGGSVTQLETFY